ncbi:AT-rich interactive domain-containing protein 4A isoform X1 [Tachysurus vachellii]|uniref:AT-rich interactive domain-containing protein 4A isoform X1 n=1 Tax=Tachysurus vachellii TaxID=175792 RepID=UPI00296B2446|nr:AT-rich interactive domain-containing protein 4A isoform X1 [Tachysurus vachellii]
MSRMLLPRLEEPIGFRETQPWLNSLLFRLCFATQASRERTYRSILPNQAGLHQIAITMKVADEPAYLTVGTDVSAKYRGAFCEAKIKTVKRIVKVKVMLKGESTSQVVQDDQVKGPLRVGSTVEVKSAEGVFSEAVINKLTDASWYTVVFDDGDEKTLRRTSLCLKGERHFAESETLDQLPLTNPEHFGTPVIGKKTNRGRRSSQAVVEDEKESSSSEEEEDDRRRLSDDLLGKVVFIQTGPDQACWFHALVISPSCNDDLTVKKDQCLVRSFADSKFHIVGRNETQELCLDTLCKSEHSDKNGFEDALLFLQTKHIPDAWKMDMSEILESSSSDEGESKESEEEEKEPEPEEPDDEPDPEERDYFLQQLYKFMEDRGTPINKPPVLGYKDLNLFKLFRLVYQHGGCDNIESGSIWKQVYMDLGIPVLNSAASYNVKTAYKKYLYGFEEYVRSAQIQFRTVHHNEPRPVIQLAVKSVEQEKEVESEEQIDPIQEAKAKLEGNKDKPDGDESDGEDEKIRKDLCSPRGRRRCTVPPMKMEGKEPVKQEKVKEEKKREEVRGGGEGSGEEQKEKREGDLLGKRRSRRLEESDKDSDEEDQEEDDEEDEDDDDDRHRLRERDEREHDGGDEESECSVTGTKVKVKYGKGKTQKIYEANIKNTETDDGEVLYLVHYYGWNVRYDEWVKADRIIWPVDKGGTKRRQKKKVKNKDEGEKEEDKQPKPVAKRGRPPLKSTPPSTSRSVSKTPNSEGRSGIKSSRLSDPSTLPNGEGTPRRRTRTTSGMYDSDKASNDSGNSSEESEDEDTLEKKPEWAETTDPATARKQEEEEEKEKEMLEEKRRLEAAETACSTIPQEKPQLLEESEMDPEEEMAMSPESGDKSPKSRAKRVRQRESGSEPLTQLPATTNHAEPEGPGTLSRHPKKPQDSEHIIPVEQVPQTAGSDTDSATEDIGPPERSCAAKRKATEHWSPDKKIRLEHKEEPKTLSSPEKKSDTERTFDDVQETEEPLVPSVPAILAPPEELEVKTEMPALTKEVQIRVEPLVSLCTMKEDSSAITEEEMMPQIGPEALVCHEVDLDDPEEKEKPSGEELLVLREEKTHVPTSAVVQVPPQQPAFHLPSSLTAAAPPQLSSPSSAPSPDESHSTKSESDATIEADSMAESHEGLGENFDASASSSNSSISLQERDTKDKGQKRLHDCSSGSSTKKQKRNQKRLGTASGAEKNGAGHSSDSEDLSALDTSNKLTPVKHSNLAKAHKLSRSPGHASPSSKDMEKDKHKDKQSFPSPRTYKWTFQLNELDNMSSTERISFLQDKLQEIRKYYMSLKSEVASIDRRRKRLKKKEREVSHTTASTSSGSSDTGMSPSSASPTQNTVAVECR